jgi:putative heme-binding domain-containing protein
MWKDRPSPEEQLALEKHLLANPSDPGMRMILMPQGVGAGLISTFASRALAGRDPDARTALENELTRSIHPSFDKRAISPRDARRIREIAFGKGESPEKSNAETLDWRVEARPGDDDSIDTGFFVFFHPAGPGCSRCHTIHGRGGKVGPDLSKIGAIFTREKLIDSILEPSKEISPQFTNWQVVHTDGRIFTGMIVHENEGKTILGDREGKTIELKTHEIEERRPVPTSVMPEKLTDRMTVQEWRDLLAYLQSLK